MLFDPEMVNGGPGKNGSSVSLSHDTVCFSPSQNGCSATSLIP